MPRRASGFTLIELVIVIVLLGVLAALAIPRFTSLQRETRLAVVDALYASLRSGAVIVNAKAVRAGVTAAAQATVDIDGEGMPGGAVAVNYGYPQATQAALSGLYDEFSERYGFLGGGNAPGGAITIALDGLDACGVRYTSPGAADAFPRIERSTSGC